MRMSQWIKAVCFVCLSMLFLSVVTAARADTSFSADDGSIDRIQLVTEQINLLKNRLAQAETELASLKQDEEISPLALEKASKKLLDKASLDILVVKSNLESINIELTDAQQIGNWLEKNITEIENQLNVLNIFGLKNTANEYANVKEFKTDLKYQKNLLELEKTRVKYLQNLQNVVNAILTQKNAKYYRLDTMLKSRRMLNVKQQQVKDELAYQQQQNHWLEELNVLYTRLGKIDPSQMKTEYTAVERDIFYANENANFAYTQSLIARYRDQIQQMRTAVFKNTSISLLNEIGNQVQTLVKQINRLETVLATRIELLDKHINYLTTRRKGDQQFDLYLKKLTTLKSQYKSSDNALIKLNDSLSSFRKTLDQALQTELSARQGLPTFDTKTLVDFGKEMLLLPALSFQVVKSLSNHLFKAFHDSGFLTWTLFALLQGILLFSFFFTRKILATLIDRPSEWRDQINSRWLSLLCLQRNFVDLFLFGNTLAIMCFFNVPLQNYIVIAYLGIIWFICKSMMIVSRICLVETTHDSSGHDVRLYRRLRWIIVIGGMIVALTVFVHQLPLIYELKTLCDRLFLLLLMTISLLLLRSREVVPNLILWHMETQHPYLQRSIRFIGILVPLLILANSIIGLLGFMNLVMTVSWYEGIFLIVLIVYLVVRGLLTDAMEQLSRMMIRYTNNGWLLTEAFLKPLDTVLRITLFLVAWAGLFLLYGWDNQSPIVVRLTGLLHYQLISVLNTTITPLNILELLVVISIFYWTAKWTREFVYRLLFSRTKDMGIRNSIAILTQYCVVILGVFICLRVLGIDLSALTVVAASFAFGIGLGLRDLANNFATGFLLLFERPIRVGDIINVGEFEGEVEHIGSRAVTISTWDHMELVVPNTEIFNKSITNWTSRDNVVRSIGSVKISRHDNPHEVKIIIQNILTGNEDILKEPMPEVLMKEMSDTLMEFEMRYYVNIRQVKSRVSVMSAVLMSIWDAFAHHGIKPPYPQHQVFLRSDALKAPTPIKKLDDDLSTA